MVTLRLVHVSDIHFRGYSEGWDYDQDQRKELLLDVARLVATGGPIDGILVGGDIAFRADPGEYELASEWLDELRVVCGNLDTGRVWTVPGNHDVNRGTVKESAFLRQFRSDVRSCATADLDDMLRDRLSTDPAGHMLVSALDAYNVFAESYGCAVTASQPHWFDTALNLDGLVVRLLGLNSVLISDDTDGKEPGPGQLVVGLRQCVIPREPATLHVVIAHHPPAWVRDWAVVEPYLRRAHLLLFGHEHAYAARQPAARGTVEVAGGAVGPERHHGAATGDYAPTYNVITLERADEANVTITIEPRCWNSKNTRFERHAEGISNFEVSIEQPPPGGGEQDPVEEAVVGATAPHAASPLVEEALATSSTQDDAVQPATELRRIGTEYMRLPWTRRVAMARDLGVLRDEDLQMPNAELFPEMLRRIRDMGLVPRLIEELDRD